MSDDPLHSKTEQEIHARYRGAPTYYLQAKLERKRALERRRYPGQDEARRSEPRPALEGETPGAPVGPPPGSPDASPEPSDALPSASDQSSGPPVESRPEPPESRPNDLFSDAVADDVSDDDFGHVSDGASGGAHPRPAYDGTRGENRELALPGFEILDAALAEHDYHDARDTPGGSPAGPALANPALTREAILEAARDDYGNWPFLSEPDTGGAAAIDPDVAAWFEPEAYPAPAPGYDSRPRLELVSEPRARRESDLEAQLQKLLDSEPELNLVLDADPELEEAFAWETDSGSPRTGVASGDFGNTGVHTVRVVSVARDRRRPNMVRIVRETSRISG